jgi:transcriptional regulator with XRE-family HTH domain
MKQTFDIYKNIREIRESKDIPQRKLAKALNMGIPVISNIEAGARDLRVSELAPIAKALGVSVIDLITYPKKYVEAEPSDLGIETVVQIKVREDKRDKLLELLLGENFKDALK